jgi:hypothetical protein
MKPEILQAFRGHAESCFLCWAATILDIEADHVVLVMDVDGIESLMQLSCIIIIMHIPRV